MLKHICSILIILITLLSIALITTKHTHALGPPIPIEYDVMGGNCGMPGTAINRCCRPMRIKPADWSHGIPVFDQAVKPLTAVINLVTQPVLNGIVNKYTEYIDKSIGKKNGMCNEGNPSTESIADTSCICLPKKSTTFNAIANLCDGLSDKEKLQCHRCLNIEGKANVTAGIWTGLGCIKGDARSFIQDFLLGWAINIAGAVSLFCIMYGAFQIQTSRGNAEKIKKSQELITSCVMGLLVIIFSIFILRLIGVDILRIPGFS